MKKLINSLVLSLVLTGCASENEPISSVCNWETSPELNLTLNEESALSDFNGFGMNFVNEYAKSPEAKLFPNFAVSPISLIEASAMLANVSNDDSNRLSIVESLGFQTLEELNTLNEKLIRYLPHNDSGNLLSMVNSLWYQQGKDVSPITYNNLTEYYKAGFAALDFASSETADIVNSWAGQSTNNLINKLITKFDYDLNTPFILANAIYFSGLWNSEFNHNETRDMLFKNYNGVESSVKMMNTTLYFGSVATEEFRMARLYYKGQNKYMDIILPEDGYDIYEIAGKLNAEKYASLCLEIDNFKSTAKFSLPIFEVSTTGSLTTLLLNMGVDLSKMSFTESGLFDQPRDILVKQKSVLKVNEKGTEAASITYTGADTGLNIPRPELDFIVDRPFMYILGDKKSSIVLMAGVIGNPNYKNN